MKEIPTKEDVKFALKVMENYILDMNEEDFLMFCHGKSVNTAMIPPRYQLYTSQDNYLRSIIRLEFRIS